MSLQDPIVIIGGSESRNRTCTGQAKDSQYFRVTLLINFASVKASKNALTFLRKWFKT